MSPKKLPELAQAWQALQAIAPVRPILNERDYARMIKLGNTLCDEVGDNKKHPLYTLFGAVMVLIGDYEALRILPLEPIHHDYQAPI